MASPAISRLTASTTPHADHGPANAAGWPAATCRCAPVDEARRISGGGESESINAYAPTVHPTAAPIAVPSKPALTTIKKVALSAIRYSCPRRNPTASRTAYSRRCSCTLTIADEISDEKHIYQK